MLEKIIHNRSFIEVVVSLAIIGSGIWLLVFNMRASEGMWRIFDDVHIVRTLAMTAELKKGQFPVRLLSDLGHQGGYMLFNFYSPLIYYITSILTLIGTHPLNAVKLAFQLCYVIAGIGMFGLLRTLVPQKVWLQVLGTLLLIGSTYFNYDAYTRGALGELFGFSLIPWAFLAYEQLKKTSHQGWMLLTAVVMSTLIYAHAITAFITLPFVGLRFLIDVFGKHIGRKQIYLLALSGILALGLSASYLLPMWQEKPLVIYTQVEYVEHAYKSAYLPIGEILGWQRNADITIKPTTVGFSLALFGCIGLLLSWLQSRKKPSSLVIFLTIALCIVLFLQIEISAKVWEWIELLRMTQFPYRFQTLFTILLILSGITGFSQFKIKSRFLLPGFIATLMAFSIYTNKEFYTPSGYYFAAEYEAADPCGTTTWQHEYLSKWTQQCLVKNHSLPVATGSASLIVERVSHNPENGDLVVTTNGEAGELVISKYYFPGWTIASNNQTKNVYASGIHGLLTTEVAAGEKQFLIRFKNTPVRTIGNTIALMSLMIVGGLSLRLSVRAFKRRLQQRNKLK